MFSRVKLVNDGLLLLWWSTVSVCAGGPPVLVFGLEFVKMSCRNGSVGTPPVQTLPSSSEVVVTLEENPSYGV